MPKPYHDGHVHVLEAMCETCVFRPGNLMQLQPGRLAGMVSDAKERDAAITCHSTYSSLYGHSVQEAVCRGFFDRHPTIPLRLAESMGIVRYVPVPPKG